MLFLRLILPFILLSGCYSTENVSSQPRHYDLEQPQKFQLGDALLEISGVAFYPKDSTIFAISDDNGDLFKIYFKTPLLVKKWKFAKGRDFEEVILLDKTFYVLNSNGDIYRLNFSETGDTIFTKKFEFPYGKNHEFESLYFDSGRNKLILICKECKDDNKHIKIAYGMDLDGNYSSSEYTINVDDIWKMSGKKQKHFRPSGAAVNPLTHDIWIISSINKMIVVTGRSGEVKDVFNLDPAKYRQPEGITFTPWGDLIISNEAGDKTGIANIYVFKYKP